MRAFIILPVFIAAAGSVPAAELILADNGQSRYTVVVPQSPSPAELLAGEELVQYLGQMAGATVEIRKGGTVPERALVIAEAPKLDSLSLPKTHVELGDEGYALRTEGERVIITGARGRSVLNGTYALLDRLGCRWLAPRLACYAGSADRVPKLEKVSLQLDVPAVSRPDLKFRKLYVEEGHSHNAENLKQMAEWMSKVGYNTLVIPTDYQGSGRVRWDQWRQEVGPELERRDLIIEVGGHGYQNFISAGMEEGQLFVRHPEWFGQNEKGERQRAKGWVFCTSNRGAVDYMTSRVMAYVKHRPEIDIFDFWPPDGAKWCLCEECTKLGSPSDRQAILVNELKAKVKQVRPDLRLEVLAYHTSIMPPEGQTLDPEVLLDYCPIAQHFWTQIDDRQSSQNLHYVEGLKAWRATFQGDISIYSYYRKYAWDSLPVMIPHYMQNDLRFYRTIPVQGVSSYAEPGDWRTYELNHYVLAELSRNIDADVDGLVRKFCDARYGQAASVAIRTIGVLEEVVRRYGSIPGTPLKSVDELREAAGRIAAAQKEIAQAAAGVAAHDEPLSGSLAGLGLICEYARRDLELRGLHAAKASPEEINRQAKELHEMLSRYSDDSYILMANQRLSLERLVTHYGIPRKRSGRP